MPSSVSNQLGELVELFVRDFICNWWVNIGTDYTFVDDVRLTTLGAVVEISRRASTVNVPVFLATDADWKLCDIILYGLKSYLDE